MNKHEKLNYIELPAKNLAATKTFFEVVFAWEFEHYGPDYIAFSNQGLDGGFYQSDLNSLTQNGAALIIFYSENLEKTQEKIQHAGGEILKAIFDFPGGRRFHFSEPSGNEFAVWSDISQKSK